MGLARNDMIKQIQKCDRQMSRMFERFVVHSILLIHTKSCSNTIRLLCCSTFDSSSLLGELSRRRLCIWSRSTESKTVKSVITTEGGPIPTLILGQTNL